MQEKWAQIQAASLRMDDIFKELGSFVEWTDSIVNSLCGQV